jgi:hypothetical protein
MSSSESSEFALVPKTVEYLCEEPEQYPDGDGEDGDLRLWGEWEGDEDVSSVVLAEGVAEIKERAFACCTSLCDLGFLGGSAVTTIGEHAFAESGIASLQGVELVRKIGTCAFAYCMSLRSVEGLACEEMGEACFAWCTLLQSMKGWPASMTVIPACCFNYCTGLTAVGCDISHVASIGANAFYGCTSLLPPSLSQLNADPAAVLAYLKKAAFNERAPLRYAIYASVLVARKQEGRRVAERRRADPLAASIALLPKEMAREIVEFRLGVVAQPPA